MVHAWRGFRLRRQASDRYARPNKFFHFSAVLKSPSPFQKGGAFLSCDPEFILCHGEGYLFGVEQGGDVGEVDAGEAEGGRQLRPIVNEVP